MEDESIDMGYLVTLPPCLETARAGDSVHDTVVDVSARGALHGVAAQVEFESRS